jgi:putative Mg2+ transporter-C (MgtC) family protein
VRGLCQLSADRWAGSRPAEAPRPRPDKFQIIPHIGALALAYALALPIGWDREKEERSAGLRTFPLVALASCGFIQAIEHLLVSSPEGMARIVEGLITGVGFIGGGAIMVAWACGERSTAPYSSPETGSSP